jgi:hypothetical protein
MIDRELDEMDVSDDLRELEALLKQRGPEEMAYMIISAYYVACDTCRDEAVSGRLSKMFTDWLLSPRNEGAKNRALQRCFCECVETGTGKAGLTPKSEDCRKPVGSRKRF